MTLPGSSYGIKNRASGKETDQSFIPHPPHFPSAHLTSMVRTLSASGKRSHTLPFIFSLIIKLWQVFQSPIFIALEAATTCSLIDSGGPERLGMRQGLGNLAPGFWPPRASTVQGGTQAGRANNQPGDLPISPLNSQVIVQVLCHQNKLI